MSFGFSVLDIATLIQFAWKITQNCKKACGEYDELTRQVQSLHAVLTRLEREKADSNSLFNRSGEACWNDICSSLDGSRTVLESLDLIISQYAPIKKKDIGIGKLWTRAKFGNKELSTLNDLRLKARFYTEAISAVLHVASFGSLGRVENLLNEAGLKDLKPAIEQIASRLAALNHKDGTVLTTYSNDDTAVWKDLRRDLIQENIVPSEIISKNKDLITSFIRELGNDGVLDNSNVSSKSRRKVTKKSTTAQSQYGKSADSQPAQRRVTADISRCSSSISHLTTTKQYEERMKNSVAPQDHIRNFQSKFTGSNPRIPNVTDDLLDTRRNQSRSDTDPIPNQNFDNAPVYIKMGEPGTRLTNGNLPSMEFEHLMPEWLVKVSQHTPAITSNTCKKNRVYCVFLATPWGLCLIVGTVNLSADIAYFKFCFNLIDVCLQHVASHDFVQHFAQNNITSHFESRQASEYIKRYQQRLISLIKCAYETCDMKVPDLGNPPTRDSIERFCDNLHQWSHDRWATTRSFRSFALQPECNLITKDLELGMFAVEVRDAMRTWSEEAFDYCGDIVLFAKSRTGQ